MAAAPGDGDLAALLAQHPSLQLNERGKLHCALTGHDVPHRADAVRQFVAGKAYAHARAWYAADFGRYAPFIVPHKRDAKKLWCRLTGHELNRIPEEVEAHVAGRRYRLRLAEAQARKAKGRDPFATAAEAGEDDAGGGGGDDDDDALGMIEFDLIDGDRSGGGDEEGEGAADAHGSAAAATLGGGDTTAAAAPAPRASRSGGKGARRRPPTAMDEEDEDGEEEDDDDDDDGDSDDSGIEVDDEFFAGNDAALAAVGIIKPPKTKKHGGPRRGTPSAASSADGGSRARVTGKHGRTLPPGGSAIASGAKKRRT